MTSSGQPTRRTHFDMLNRDVESRVQAFDGVSSVVTETEYDTLHTLNKPPGVAGAALKLL